MAILIDAEKCVNISKISLVAEPKLKISQNGWFLVFSISALPSEGPFQMSTHFKYLWPPDEIFLERQYCYKMIEQNIPGGLFSSDN